MMRNAAIAEQSGFILPMVQNAEGNKEFSFEIVSVTGQKAHDTNAIIARYAQEILTCLFADFLSLGSNGSGSFSLAESKVSVVEMAIETKLIEIRDQLNHDLIPQLFSLNGWSSEVTPYFTFGEIAKQDLDVLSKFIQRVGAAGLLPKTPKVVNWLMDSAGIPDHVDNDLTTQELSELLTPETSNAGEGMTEGMPSGTGKATGGGDQSTGNSENS